MKRVILPMGLVVCCLVSCNNQRQEASTPLGFFDSTHLWKQNPISVCWENPSEKDKEERAWVKNRIQKTWEEVAKVDFVGWESCEETNTANIRILLEDTVPHTLGLGSKIDGKKDGMRLNFDFKNWNASCLTKHTRQFCIETIATHEFGHALGIAHEHNRDDRDIDCTKKIQGHRGNTTVGDFDRRSIMNYCFGSGYSNKISEGDVKTIQAMYGKREDKTFVD